MSFHTSHYTIGENEPNSQPEQALSEIVHIVKKCTTKIFEDKNIGLSGEHPRIVISMIITNILVNLSFGMIATNDISIRLKLFEDQIAEIKEMSLNLWTSMEANRADVTREN